MNAVIEIAGLDGKRSVPIGELYRLPETTPDQEFNLAPGELITAIVVPKVATARASVYHKIRDRESYAFALASAAVAVEMDGRRVRSANIALGGVATRPWRASASEARLTGAELTPDIALEAGRLAFADARPGRHNAFKIELGSKVVADALMIAAERSV